MPITGTFLADFSQFSSAVDGAGAKLRAFEGDAGKAGTSIQTMESAARTSVPMLSQLMGLLTVGTVVAFGREVLSAGSNIQKMSDQMSLGTDEVQRFMHIAGQSDTSVQSLVSAVQNLQQRLGDDNSGAAGAMRRLGINADTFGKLGTYQQVLTLSDALREETDVNQRASDGAALFGKTWKEVGPAITSNMRQIGDQAPIMAEATVESLDRIDDAMKRAEAQAIVWGGSVVLLIENLGNAAGQFVSQFNPEHFGIMTEDLLAMQVALNDPDGLIRALEKAKPPAAELNTGIKALGLSAGEAAALERELTAAAMASIKVNTDAEAAVKKLTDAQVRHLDLILPGMSKLAELERGRAIQAGRDPKFDEMGLKTLDFGLGGKDAAKPFGALAIDMAKQTAIREQTEAEAALALQMKENFLIVGAVGDAHKEAAEKAKQATDDTIKGYAAATQQVTMTGDAIRAYIELQKYSAAANAILDENKLFTSRSQLERISKLPMGGGGGSGVTVHINASNSFLNTPADTQRLAETVGNSVKTQLMGHGRQVG